MPTVNFAGITEESNGVTLLEEGTYPCRLAEVDVAETSKGDEMWRLRWVVEEGPHQGRLIFDNLVFSSAALGRLKLVCERLGIDTSGELDLRPSMLRGRHCLVRVEIEDYEAADGQLRKRNVVPWAGYGRADDSSATAVSCKTPPAGGRDDDIPF